jgi:hypothetical protein
MFSSLERLEASERAGSNDDPLCGITAEGIVGAKPENRTLRRHAAACRLVERYRETWMLVTTESPS